MSTSDPMYMMDSPDPEFMLPGSSKEMEAYTEEIRKQRDKLIQQMTVPPKYLFSQYGSEIPEKLLKDQQHPSSSAASKFHSSSSAIFFPPDTLGFQLKLMDDLLLKYQMYKPFPLLQLEEKKWDFVRQYMQEPAPPPEPEMEWGKNKREPTPQKFKWGTTKVIKGVGVYKTQSGQPASLEDLWPVDSKLMERAEAIGEDAKSVMNTYLEASRSLRLVQMNDEVNIARAEKDIEDWIGFRNLFITRWGYDFVGSTREDVATIVMRIGLFRNKDLPPKTTNAELAYRVETIIQSDPFLEVCVSCYQPLFLGEYIKKAGKDFNISLFCPACFPPTGGAKGTVTGVSERNPRAAIDPFKVAESDYRSYLNLNKVASKPVRKKASTAEKKFSVLDQVTKKFPPLPDPFTDEPRRTSKDTEIRELREKLKELQAEEEDRRRGVSKGKKRGARRNDGRRPRRKIK